MNLFCYLLFVRCLPVSLSSWSTHTERTSCKHLYRPRVASVSRLFTTTASFSRNYVRTSARRMWPAHSYWVPNLPYLPNYPEQPRRLSSALSICALCAHLYYQQFLCLLACFSSRSGSRVNAASAVSFAEPLREIGWMGFEFDVE